MHTTRRSARAAACWGLMIGCGCLPMAFGCREVATQPPEPAPNATSEQATGGQAGQAHDPTAAQSGQSDHSAETEAGQTNDQAGLLTASSANPAGTEHTGPWAMDGSEEGPVAGLPLIITLEVPEVPEKIRGPTPMPGS